MQLGSTAICSSRRSQRYVLLYLPAGTVPLTQFPLVDRTDLGRHHPYYGWAWEPPTEIAFPAGTGRVEMG